MHKTDNQWLQNDLQTVLKLNKTVAHAVPNFDPILIQ